jgi:spermidine synthase
MPISNYYLEHWMDEIHMHGVKRTVVSTQTKYQKIDIVDTYNYGRCLFLDERLQSSEYDSFIYHEALVHPPLLLHPDPRKVMIVGGGEGETLRDILKHRSVEKVIMVDIDKELVDFCKKELPQWAGGAFKDKRTKVIHMDARAYLEKTKEVFDVIIIDLTEPIEGGPSFKLYTKEFYQLVHKRLSPYGLITLQAGTTRPWDTDMLTSIAKTISCAFPITRIYQVMIPSFGLPWGFIMGSKDADPLTYSPSQIDSLIKKRGLRSLEYYDGITHLSMFALPKYLRRDYDMQKRIITDKNLMIAKFE